MLVLLSDTYQNNSERVLEAAREVLAGAVVRPVAEPARALKQCQHRLSADETATIAAEYQAGASTYQLAKTWHVSRETVTLALRRAGVEARERGVLTPPQLVEARRLRGEGWSLNQLGARYGIAPKTVRRRLDEPGAAL